MKSPLPHLIVALVIGVVLLGGYGFWYVAIANKGSAIAALQSKIDMETAIATQLKKTRAAFTDIAGDEAIVQSYFISEAAAPVFIDDIETRGRSFGATTSVLSVSRANATKQSALAFALSISGKFDAVMRTVGAIEYAPYDLSISTLSVAQDAKNSWHADLTMSVGISTTTVATSTP